MLKAIRKMWNVSVVALVVFVAGSSSFAGFALQDQTVDLTEYHAVIDQAIYEQRLLETYLSISQERYDDLVLRWESVNLERSAASDEIKNSTFDNFWKARAYLDDPIYIHETHQIADANIIYMISGAYFYTTVIDVAFFDFQNVENGDISDQEYYDSQTENARLFFSIALNDYANGLLYIDWNLREAERLLDEVELML